MRIITKRRILDYAKLHPNAAANLAAWISVVTAAKWQSIADVRKVLPHADLATVGSSKTGTIFNTQHLHPENTHPRRLQQRPLEKRPLSR